MNLDEERPPSPEPMHRRVEDSLAYRLAMHGLRVSEPGARLQRDLDQLPLFVSIGALSESEAAVWRERFVLAAEAFMAPDGEVVDDDQRIRARRLLADALRDYERSSPDSDTHPFWRFSAMLRALKAVGAVSEDEAREWDRNFHELLERKSKPRREARLRVERQEHRGPAPGPRYRAAALVRVVPGPAMRWNGVRVTCAELYEDCVVIRWHRVLSGEEIADGEKACRGQPTAEETEARFGVALALEDDLGTHYAPAARAHQLTGDIARAQDEESVPVWGRSAFAPAVPDGANLLVPRNGEDEFRLAL